MSRFSAIEVDQLTELDTYRRGPAVTPAPESEHHVHQILPLVGEPVLVTRRVFLVLDGFEDPGGDEALESVGEDIAGNPEVFGKVIEPADAHERIPDDHHIPPVTDDIDVLGD